MRTLDMIIAIPDEEPVITSGQPYLRRRCPCARENQSGLRRREILIAEADAIVMLPQCATASGKYITQLATIRR